jgi:hypothetical protein
VTMKDFLIAFIFAIICAPAAEPIVAFLKDKFNSTHRATTYSDVPDVFLRCAPRDFFVIALFGVLLNLVGAVVLRGSQGIVFLDTIGTALASFTLGPWWGASVGLATNAIGALPLDIITDPHEHNVYHLFAPVNCLTAVAWGTYGLARRHDIMITNIEDSSSWPIIRSILKAGFVGVLTSSLCACYILYFVLHITAPATDLAGLNQFHVAMYQFIATKFPANIPAAEFVRFVLCELFFNIPDKLLSVAFALTLMHVILPVAGAGSDFFTPVRGFVKASSSSHVAFFVGYIIYVIVLLCISSPMASDWLCYLPFGALLLSYLVLRPRFASATPFQGLIEHLEKNPRPSRVLARFLRVAAFGVAAVMVYLSALIALGIWGDVFGAGKRLDNVAEAVRAVFSLGLVLALFVIATPMLVDVAWRWRHYQGTVAGPISATHATMARPTGTDPAATLFDGRPGSNES